MTWPPKPPIPDLSVLEQDLTAASIPVPNGLGMHDWPAAPVVYTYDAQGQMEALPSSAQPIVDAFIQAALAA